MSTTTPTVAVVGTGAIGAMALWHLADRGLNPIGFDAYAPGHDRGGYGGQTRIFRVAYREGAEYVPLLRESLTLWRRLETETGSNLLTLTGGLTIAPADHDDLAMVRRCAREFDLPHTELTAEAAALRFPQLPVHPGEEAFLDHTAGVLRPELSVLTAASRAEELGATLHRYTPITALDASDGGVELHTDSGTHRVDRVVLAPGPWAQQLPQLAGLPLEVHQITTMWFQAREPWRFVPERTPIVIRNGPIAYSCFPAVDGETVKVSLHSLPRPHVPTAEDVSRNATAELTAAMREAVTTFLPGLYPDPVRVSTYSDCFTSDGHAVVGSLPGLPNVTVLTGFSGHGFKMAPVLGAVAADLAIDGETERDINHLSPTRFTSAS